MKKIYWLIFFILLIFFGTLLYSQVFQLACGPSGGKGGNLFIDTSTPNQYISEIKVRSGNVIDSIQVTYKDSFNVVTTGSRHGGTGGRESVFRLAPDEYIVSIGGKYGNNIDKLWIKTNKGRTQEWGGNGGNVDFTYVVPDGWMIISFWGRSGKYLDAIGVYYQNIR